jgi:hypothetical protein
MNLNIRGMHTSDGVNKWGLGRGTKYLYFNGT